MELLFDFFLVIRGGFGWFLDSHYTNLIIKDISTLHLGSRALESKDRGVKRLSGSLRGVPELWLWTKPTARWVRTTFINPPQFRVSFKRFSTIKSLKLARKQLIPFNTNKPPNQKPSKCHLRQISQQWNLMPLPILFKKGSQENFLYFTSPRNTEKKDFSVEILLFFPYSQSQRIILEKKWRVVKLVFTHQKNY